jgi:hypothetical protein
MSNKKQKSSTYSWMLRDDADRVSDVVIDAFLNAIPATDSERIERIRRVFVHRLLASLHRIPVRHIEQPWSFGRWIEAIRTSVGLTRADVAVAIDGDVGFVERIEQSDILPWQLKTTAVADLICLFRVHISAVEQLFLKSEAVLKGHQTAAAAARSSATDLATRGESARRALDLYLAAKSKAAESTGIPPAIMDNLRRELERRQAFELLGVAD